MAGLKRIGRQRTQLPNCYYEGYLDKRSFKDKISRKLWTCLCGNTLFFFNNNKENDYVEKIELNDFISLMDDSNRDKNLGSARFNLHMKNEDINLTAPSLETRELWKGYIHSVVELSVPSSLNLLPGQVQMMREVVERERERLHNGSSPPAPAASSNLYLSLVSEMPPCFQQVSRNEAEIILEKYRGRGNLLLRPGRDGTSFAVTTYQDLNGPVFRHYRVTKKHDGRFSIDVENPIPCATLHDVITCLVEKTGGGLSPFIMEAPYEESITFVQSNEENGERSLQCASRGPSPRAITPDLNPPPQPPPLPPSFSAPDSAPAPLPKPGQRDHATHHERSEEAEQSLYLNDSQVEDKGRQTPIPLMRSRLPILRTSMPNPSALPKETGPERTALKPPTKQRNTSPRSFSPTPNPTPRPSSSSSTSSTDSMPEPRLRRLTAGTPGPDILKDMSLELKLKLEKRRVLE